MNDPVDRINEILDINVEWREFAFAELRDAYGDLPSGVSVDTTDPGLRALLIAKLVKEAFEAKQRQEELQATVQSLSDQLVDTRARLNAAVGNANDYPRMMFHVTGKTATVTTEAEEQNLPPVMTQGVVVDAPNRGWFRVKKECDDWMAEHPEAVGTVVYEGRARGRARC